jgi:hypothetical protein
MSMHSAAATGAGQSHRGALRMAMTMAMVPASKIAQIAASDAIPIRRLIEE